MTIKPGRAICALLSTLVLIYVHQDVAGDAIGQGASTCSARGTKDLQAQLCPKNGNDRKYVRIKTFHGRYLWAYATDSSGSDNTYVRTRCCGKNDAVGRKDTTAPGTTTTFRVYCSSNKATVRFEILKNPNQKGSGYFLYADIRYRNLKAKRRPSASDRDSQFIVKRWRGPVVAIKSAKNLFWWHVLDDRNGLVPINKDRVRTFPDVPPLYDQFTLEIVPRECVEVKSNERILAARHDIKPEECHRKPDRCYWTDGWDVTRKRIKPGTCYYMKDSMCYQHRSRQSCPHRNAKDCEAAGCCYDYQRNQCYRGKV